MLSNLDRKSKERYSPYFPEVPPGYSQNEIKYKSYTKSFETKNDVYDTIVKAESRSYNLGCSGYRKVLVSADGIYKYSPCTTLSEYQGIIKEMPKVNTERKYYDFDQDDNIYDVMRSVNNKNLWNGFNYKENLFKKTLSNVIYRDPTKESILNNMQRVVFALIESVKRIKNHFNYTVPSNNKRVF